MDKQYFKETMIEIIETKDYNLLAELNEEIQTFHHKTVPNIFKPYDKAAISTFYKDALRNENAVAFAAKENDVTVGYVLLFVVNMNETPFQYARKYVLLDQILVVRNYQSKGVGSQLLDAVFSFAKALKIDRIELDHWTQNELARKFFAKSGFDYYNEKMWKLVE